MPNNNDFIDRKIEGTTKIFGMADKNVYAFMLTISIIFNFWIFYLYTQAKNETVEVTNDLNKTIVEEVRKQVAPAVRQEVKQQVTPIAKSVDTTNNTIKEFIERVEK